jgi:hypothetical protein
MGITNETTILDVGGTPEFWRKFAVKPKVILLNVDNAPAKCAFPMFAVRHALCRSQNKSFDIVFSNSVIEHLGSWSNQIAAAEEMTRLRARVWIQTPNRTFPVDPHLLTPFVHWLPERYLKKAIPYTIAGLIWNLSAAQLDSFIREIRLLRLIEMRALFPSCGFATEKVAGLTKSFIAISERSH